MALTRLRGEQLDGWLQRSAEVSGESSQRLRAQSRSAVDVGQLVHGTFRDY